jgi:hypothetical protein
MSTDEIEREVDMHGKITVTLQRGHRMVEENSEADVDVLWEGYDVPDTKVSSKQVVKDNRVSHAVE